VFRARNVERLPLTSELGQSRPNEAMAARSALPPTSDIRATAPKRRDVPRADTRNGAKGALFDHLVDARGRSGRAHLADLCQFWSGEFLRPAVTWLMDGTPAVATSAYSAISLSLPRRRRGPIERLAIPAGKIERRSTKAGEARTR